MEHIQAPWLKTFKVVRKRHFFRLQADSGDSDRVLAVWIGCCATAGWAVGCPNAGLTSLSLRLACTEEAAEEQD